MFDLFTENGKILYGVKMKIFFLFILFLMGQQALGMGSSPVFPGNPLSPTENQYLNDMEETTVGINQFSPDRGHLDQQKMEEKKMTKDKNGQNKIESQKEKPLPAAKMNINYE